MKLATVLFRWMFEMFWLGGWFHWMRGEMMILYRLSDDRKSVMGLFNELCWFRERRSGCELSNGRLALSLIDDLRTDILSLIFLIVSQAVYWNPSYLFFVQILFKLGFADNWTLNLNKSYLMKCLQKDGPSWLDELC